MLNKIKNGFRNKKPKAPEPRQLPEITAQYNELSNKAGQVQYQIFAYNRELDRLNAALENLNYEAAARQKLDSQTIKPADAAQQGSANASKEVSPAPQQGAQ